MLCPGFTMTISPTRTSSDGISSSRPSRSTSAVLGARSISLVMASDVRLFDRVSIYFPMVTSARIMAAASKYRFMAQSWARMRSPRPMAYPMTNSWLTLYAAAAVDPMATSVSILGAPCSSVLNPFSKYFRFRYITGSVRINWVSAKIITFSWPVRIPGSGKPSICPMDTYISTTRNTMDHKSRCFMARVSSDAFFCTSLAAFLTSCPFTEAPYPASVTASIIVFSSTAPSAYSTVMEFCRRFT